MSAVAETLLVLTNLPDRDAAMTLANAVIDAGVAACVNVLEPCTSVYRWEGKVENATEVPVLIKTRAALYPEVEAAISELHPYELPEIIAVPVGCGLADYLDWVGAETTISIG